ncbi:MAG: DUF2807 domain-containing protein [Saprospiraceae bacterium]|nr:DUF2807 domain-containing protein [Saprospiraceae bacterium]
MKKLLFGALALLLLTNFAVAQQTETIKEKEEAKKSTKNKNYNYNNWNNWGGGERVVGEGPSVSETRDVKNFTGFKSSISADITVKQTSGNFNVTIEGQKNIIALVKCEVVDGTLKIGFEKGYSINHKEPLKIHIEAPSFSYMGMSGSGNVRSKSGLTGEKLTVNISGSGDFDLNDLKFNNLNVGISGSGDIDLAGSVESVELSISGSGDLNAENLKAQKAQCRVSGSGDISLNVSKELDASISGSGDISYSGKPATVHKRVSGSGDIVSK